MSKQQTKPSKQSGLFSRVLLATFLLSSTLLAGCFDYEEEIIVHEDGSVEVRVVTAVLQSAMPALKRNQEFSFFIGAAAGKEKLQSILPETMDVRSASSVVERGWIHSDMHLVAKDIKDFTNAMGSVSPSHHTRFWQNPDGTYELERIIVQPKVAEAFRHDSALRFVDQHLEKSKLKFELTTPFKILDTNGMRLTDHRVRWKTDMAFVHKMGLRLWVKFEEPPLAYRISQMPTDTKFIFVGIGFTLILLIGSFVLLWRHRKVASD